MNNLKGLLASSIGRKLVVGLTGLFMFLWLLGHLLGNMLIFQGADAINGYALMLKSNTGLLWGVRSVMLGAFLLHVWGAVTLNMRSDQARPVPYFSKEVIAATLMSRTMLQTGIVVALFVLFHLAHFTGGVIHSEAHSLLTTLPDQEGQIHDVFGMIVASFSNPLTAFFYIACMVVLALHLSHGIQSAIQTIGFHHPIYSPLIQKGSIALAILLCAGNCLIPLSVMAGIIAKGSS